MHVALHHKKATYARCIAMICGSCENLDYRTAIITRNESILLVLT